MSRDFKRLMGGLVLFFVLAIAGIAALPHGADAARDASNATGTRISCSLALCDQAPQPKK